MTHIKDGKQLRHFFDSVSLEELVFSVAAVSTHNTVIVPLWPFFSLLWLKNITLVYQYVRNVIYFLAHFSQRLCFPTVS